MELSRLRPPTRDGARTGPYWPLFCGLATAVMGLHAGAGGSGTVVVFWQPGFPTIGSQPLSQATLRTALQDGHPAFADLDALVAGHGLAGAELLVLPYGSAVPAQAWASIRTFLEGGGNLLVLGGQPFRVPVIREHGAFQPLPAQDSYARALDIRHAYALPGPLGSGFCWKPGYEFLGPVQIKASRVFALEGDGRGLGFFQDAEGLQLAAPVVVKEHTELGNHTNPMLGSRMVLLDFEPEPGYWESADGLALIRKAAGYARQGSSRFWVETQYATVKPGEFPDITVHYRHPGQTRPGPAEVSIELLAGETVIDSYRVPVATAKFDHKFFIRKPLAPGFYQLRGVYRTAGVPQESYQNGFWVEDPRLLKTGPVLGVEGDFLTRDGAPFLPVGANYFATDNAGWNFDAPRNALAWERDCAEMERSNLTFIRTGVWTGTARFTDDATAQPNERFLRNLEGLLLSARKHQLMVNFTFFAFAPSAGQADLASANPYLDPGARAAQAEYMQAIVARFKDAPNVCWDLINEPSFSNARQLWRTVPNGDALETARWRAWLRERYPDFPALAQAWRVRPEELGGGFDAVPLPTPEEMAFQRNGNPKAVRAFDYLLFAQTAFCDWARQAVETIRATGSRQLINVGNDEGGVADRLLNHFYASSGLAFTTNHTYWRDDALLWSSLAAKVPGMPNLIGETNYQPVHEPDGVWRYDETTGFGNQERKMVLGFAGGSSGALIWDWDPQWDFGTRRSDGSAKRVQTMIRELGEFARKAAPYATGFKVPQTAIVMPQSFQLSARVDTALRAQQTAVRALYSLARGEACLVGEYQLAEWGNPRLIIVPSPTTLSRPALEALRERVAAGATVLMTGPFDRDPHFHPTGLQERLGLTYGTEFLLLRDHQLQLPSGQAPVTFGGNTPLYLDRAVLPGGATWAEQGLGKGKVLFCPLPLELNDNLEAVALAYRRAMAVAGVEPSYRTSLMDRGITICPAHLKDATLYAIVSESSASAVAFEDVRSGKSFSGTLEPGRAALVLVGADGVIKASYNWR